MTTLRTIRTSFDIIKMHVLCEYRVHALNEFILPSKSTSFAMQTYTNQDVSRIVFRKQIFTFRYFLYFVLLLNVMLLHYIIIFSLFIFMSKMEQTNMLVIRLKDTKCIPDH